MILKKTILILLTIFLSIAVQAEEMKENSQVEQAPTEQNNEPIKKTEDKPSEQTPPTVVEDTKESTPSFKTALTIYYSTASTIKFNNANATIASFPVDGEITYNTEPAISFGAAVANTSKNSWGFMGSFLYETQRSIDSLRLSSSVGSMTVESDSKFSVIIFEGSVVYSLEQAYFPIGVNYNIPMVQDGGTLKSSVRGNIGYSVGAGLFINEKNSIELFYRNISVSMTGKDGSDIYDFGTGYTQGISVGWKYWL